MRIMLAVTGIAAVVLILVGLVVETARWLIAIGAVTLIAPTIADAVHARAGRGNR